jgi:hypothetical protein
MLKEKVVNIPLNAIGDGCEDSGDSLRVLTGVKRG